MLKMLMLCIVFLMLESQREVSSMRRYHCKEKDLRSVFLWRLSCR